MALAKSVECFILPFNGTTLSIKFNSLKKLSQLSEYDENTGAFRMLLQRSFRCKVSFSRTHWNMFSTPTVDH